MSAWAWIRSAILRGVVLALLWVVLVEGDVGYFGYGVVAVPLVVAASLWLSPPRGGAGRPLRGRAVGWVRLVGWMLHRMFAGGVDVARRAVSRPVDIDPVEVRVPVALHGAARSFALALFNLTPGTIVMEVGNDAAVIHALSTDLDVVGTWAQLEGRVAAAMGRELEG